MFGLWWVTSDYGDFVHKKMGCFYGGRNLWNMGFIFLPFNIFLASPKDMLIDLRQGERKGEREEKYRREWETSIGCLPHTLLLGLDPELRHVPWLGIEPASFWFTRGCSDQQSHTSQNKTWALYKAIQVTAEALGHSQKCSGAEGAYKGLSKGLRTF